MKQGTYKQEFISEVTVFSRWGRKWMVSYGLENI